MNNFDIKNKNLLSGTNLIDASAGTGKTFSMALIVLKMILEKEPPINIDQILAVTFTKAATHELKSRIRLFIREAYDYTEAVLNNKKYEDKNQAIAGLIDEISDKKEVLKKLNYSLLWLDEAPVFTIHSFCQRTIKEYAFELNAPFNPDVSTNQNDIYAQILNDLERKKIHEECNPKPQHPAFIHFMSLLPGDLETEESEEEEHTTVTETVCIDKVVLDQKIIKAESAYNGELSDELRQLYTQRELQLQNEEQEHIKMLLAKRKEEENVLTYDDLIDTLFNAVECPETLAFLRKSLPNKYKVVMVDEFQDTDKKQATIFQKIFEDTDTVLIFIGDPKQSIYAFRGAQVAVYNEIASLIPEEKRHTLDTNYRATPNMVEAVNKFFTTTPLSSGLIGSEIINLKCDQKNSEYKLSNDNKISGEIVCLYQPLEELYLNKTATKYKIMNKGDRKRPGANAAVVNAVKNEIARLLDPKNKLSINEKNIGPSDIAILVGTHEQANDLKVALDQRDIPCVTWGNSSVFEEPELDDVILLARAMATPSNSTFIKTALFGEIIGFNNLKEIQENEDLWLEWVERFRQYHELWNKQGFFSAFTHIVNAHCKNKIIKKVNGLRKITNLMHIAELVLTDLGVQEYTPTSVLKYLERKKLEAKDDSEAYMKRLETEQDVVNIMTIHKSKGLEFPIVFIPFAWSTKSKGTQEGISEETRLLYVAVTRAKSRAYINWGKINTSNKAALGQILYDQIENEKFKSFDDDYIIEKLTNFFSYVHTVSSADASQHEIQIDEPTLVPEKIKSFNKTLDSGFTIYSYTSLAHKDHRPKRYLDFDEEPVIKQLPKKEQVLPLGARTGIIIHSIFEELDFQKVDTQVINSSELDAVAVKELVSKTLNQELDTNGFKLKQLSMEQRASEMEFCFLLDKAALKNKDLLNQIAELNINIDGDGFIKGYMDLVFEHQGKYYILDWKTNYLGDSETAYSEDNVSESVVNNNYNLQYLLYSVALNLHLSRTLPDYKYEKDFGGVYYLFVRGISGGDKKNGVFFNRPEQKVVTALTKYLTGVEYGQ